MKKYLILLLWIFIVLTLNAQQSFFDYIEGEVSIKKSSGELVKAKLGDSVVPGDSVITGIDGFAELTLENNSLITVDNDTVFLYSQREKEKKKKSIFMVVLGKIGFKFDKLLNEPDIQTPTTIAGVRGTEFTVVSALDGSSFYVVSEGSVAVESEGSLVVLEMEEGVEVPVGETPGEKFEVKVGQEDFSGWLEQGKERFLKDPAGVLENLSDRLVEFSNEAVDNHSLFENSSEELAVMREKLTDLSAKKDDEGKKKFYSEEVFPKEIETSNLVLNYRYYALSALSLRRYVLGPMYVQMKTRYIADVDNREYKNFLSEYERFLRIFEEKVVPYLVEADI